MRDTLIMEVNGQQFLDIQAKLWVGLICECDLYAKIYGTFVQQSFAAKQYWDTSANNVLKTSRPIEDYRLIICTSKHLPLPVMALD